MRLISIDGNIGSGKSTLLEILKTEFKDNQDIIFVREPVDIRESIKDEQGANILEKFYENTEKYSFPFQMIAYISRLALLKETFETNSNKIIISERSLFTDKCVFAKMLFDSGKIESVNYQIYLKFFDTFIKDYQLDKIIYVKTDPEKCNARIMKRGRTGESNISLDYLNACHTYHEDMIMHPDLQMVDKNIIDGNIDIYENETEKNKWVDSIKSYILQEK